ncbi:6-pyruvoyl trahydropterin synthase family protein [Nitrosophilus alvini]|uniref:6-pyruvoyl trahydropterin synthase family protein n=1 Tax=Nitrosophilus alvini TaxID=2714855 RepID=UPI00190C4D24|nr:6-carboxytetrahydropterin synthase [Nitrosophilus alvini]
MVIRKLFKFENAHIVRNCSSRRCSRSIHGHSYRVEIFFESDFLDRGQMVYDFGLTKLYIKDVIDSFDHAITLWSQDDPEYLKDMKKWSERWVELPVSPSAEQYSRVIFLMVDKVLKNTVMKNREKNVTLKSVIVHETDTGYAHCSLEDVHNKNMGEIRLEEIIFSNAVKNEWNDPLMWEKLIRGEKLENPEFV